MLRSVYSMKRQLFGQRFLLLEARRSADASYRQRATKKAHPSLFAQGGPFYRDYSLQTAFDLTPVILLFPADTGEVRPAMREADESRPRQGNSYSNGNSMGVLPLQNRRM